ncbi:hypothetical protein ACIBI4_05170 [Streptomyces sp. NPDC050418]|uniref:hypothetical protein n=1 Tax=Streptomyces sp. NPDC050418 TaxID=3365612 RepID=UPI00379D4684
MADSLYPLAPDEELPTLESHNALGTMLLHNSRADESGAFFATCWFMVILPVFPLGRYYVRRTGYRDESGLFSVRTTTGYEIVGRSRIRGIEVVRTYLLWWLLLPAAIAGPNIAAAVAWEGENAGLHGMLLSVGLLVVLLILWFLYGMYWRPVRQVRWAEEATGGGSHGRNWQGFATSLQLAVLFGLLGFFLGVAIFFTAMAMGELPTDLDPRPNPFVDSLLHPVALLAGIPVLTCVVSLVLLERFRRRRGDGEDSPTHA